VSKLLTAAVAAAVLAGLIAGCGGGDETTDETVTLTKTELITQGDAICKQGNEEIEAGFEEFAEENDIPDGKEPSDEQGVEIVEQVIVPSVKTQSELIRGLGAPEGDEEEIGEMLDSLDQAVEEAEDDPESLFNEDTDPFGDPNEKAQAYGFSECGEG
jgi:hypothetical protein